MKGAIIRSLLSFLEETGGPVFVETVIDEAELASGGAYTAEGQYPSDEAIELLAVAAAISGFDPITLSRDFGRFLFHNFIAKHRAIMVLYDNADDLLTDVDDHIHRDVQVMHPGAKPPTIRAKWDRGAMSVEYASHRPFGDIAHGLLAGCLEYFGDKRQILREDTNDTFRVRFRLEG
ncbi:hypothetical protein SZ64_10020 [Erythrobacter sp. SG61-1L]|nr:hypothetical protein SZ64_10020 [Erythrobacter sp. SG61-1L]